MADKECNSDVSPAAFPDSVATTHQNHSCGLLHSIARRRLSLTEVVLVILMIALACFYSVPTIH